MSVAERTVRLLLVEDSEDDALLLEAELARMGVRIELRRVDSAAGLAAALREGPWDLVLSDFRLPAFGGMCALRHVREFDPDLPFILVSGRIGEEAAVEAMRAGANDYVMKGNLARLCPAIERELREAQVRYQKRAAEARVTHLERHDPDTGLANRSLFSERLAAAALEGGRVGVALIDIERFKLMEAAHSADVLNELVQESAERLVRAAGSEDCVARVGDGRFALLIPRARGASHIAQAVDKALGAMFDRAYSTSAGPVTAAARAGISLHPDDGAPRNLLRNAEAALARARGGEDRYLFYSEEMSTAIAERLVMEERLRHALENGEFELHYQPQVGLKGMQIRGFEALLRWRSPELGMVMPSRFVPVLEETGMILEVGEWVMRRAAADRRRWAAEGLQAPRVAVNVSMAQVSQRDFVGVVERALGQDEGPPGIDIEITESMLMSDMRDCVGKLEALRDLGLRIVLDDFGVGYSSLAYLTRLPAAALKIDRSFIAPMLHQPRGRALVSMIVNMARNLGLEVVAEGIEERAQLDALREMGCDQAQGYLLGRPAPFEHARGRLRAAPPVGGGLRRVV